MYNEILLSLKKEGNFNTCYNMNEPRGHYAKLDTRRKIQCDSSYMRYLALKN